MVVVADTSALVSLGAIADRDPSPLALLLDGYDLVVPERVAAELDETAGYDDAHGLAAERVLAQRQRFEVASVTLNESFPLNDGENAAVALANDRGAAFLLCDEYNSIGLVHASLRDVRLATTPALLAVFVENGRLSASTARGLLDAMAEVRSWTGNSYVARARETLSDGA
jgi:predicted nucleic acid-binding protein